MRRAARAARAARGGATTAAALLLAACSDPATPPAGPRLASGAASLGIGTPPWNAGATVAWNQLARQLVTHHRTGAPPAIRAYAMLSVAQYNAVVAAKDAAPNPRPASEAAAVAGASATVLAYLYPGDSATLEGIVDAQEQASSPAGETSRDFAAGERIGRNVGAAVVARARGDHFFDPFTGAVPICAGCWLATPTPPAFATLGQARTWFLASASQFRPAPPPPFESSAFNAALAEVRQVSDTRTAAQDSIAKLWSLQGGTVTPLGHWNVVGARLVAQHHLDELRGSYVLALMNAAGYDAVVASHEAKYVYWLIRPSQADPLITLPIALPSFPSYPSNHAAISAAAATVLGRFFPAERGALQSAAIEAGISRLYGGIHYRFDVDAGLVMGRSIGEYVLSRAPVGRTPVALQ